MGHWFGWFSMLNKLHIHLWNVVVRFMFSSILQILYMEVWIFRCISESTFDFEITRVTVHRKCTLTNHSLPEKPKEGEMKTQIIYQNCDQWRFWSDCANAQADLNLRWTYMSDDNFWCYGSCCVGDLCVLRQDYTCVKSCKDMRSAHKSQIIFHDH